MKAMNIFYHETQRFRQGKILMRILSGKYFHEIAFSLKYNSYSGTALIIKCNSTTNIETGEYVLQTINHNDISN